MYTYIITQWFCRYIFGKFVAGRDLTMFSNYFFKKSNEIEDSQHTRGMWGLADEQSIQETKEECEDKGEAFSQRSRRSCVFS